MDIRNLHKKRSNLLASTSLIHRAGFALAFLALGSHNAQANPQGGVVVGGSATITNNGPKLDVHQTSQRAVIDWRGFDIAVGEHTQFHQPNSAAIALNRVNSSSASQIDGMLSGNGNIVVINPNGVVFGKNSQVDVNGLIASTANTSNADFMAGGKLKLNIAGRPDARIINRGTITAKQAGLVGLVAPNVENSGVITANLGKVTLASGDTATVDLYGDKLVEVAVSDAVTSQLISNSGTIEAAGGTITLTAAAGANVVNSLIEVSGELKAPAVAQRNGEILIYAEGANAVIGNNAADKAKKSGASTVLISGKLEATSTAGKGGKITVTADHVGVLAGARIDASGELGGGIVHIGGAYQGLGPTPNALRTIIQDGALIQANAWRKGNGGEVVVWADNRTDFGGQINAMGGTEEGDGGSVETSGRVALNVSGNVSAISRRRGKTGEWLLDPNNIIIQAAGSDTNVSASPNFTSNNDNAIVTTASINAALNAGTSVTIMTGTGGTNLQGGDITVMDAILKSSGSGLAPTLTLSASRNIIINANITAMTAGSINLVLQANKDDFGSGYVNINADITTRNGTLTIGGGSNMTTGFAYGNAGQAAGVRINGVLDAGNNGLTIRGHGFNNAGTDNNYGVLIEGNGSITSRLNTIVGVGGAGANHNYGIYNNGRTLSSNSSAAIYTGTGGGTGNNNYGIYMHGGLIESTGSGSVTVTGTGGGLGANGSNNYGVFIDNAGSLTSAGAPGTNILATGGGAGTGTNNYGLYVTGANSRISAAGVPITISGIRGGGDAATNYGVYIDTTNGVRTTTAGNVIVKTDKLFLNVAGALVANGTLNIAGYTAGTTIGVGDGATGTLLISSAMFGYFGAANGVQIGDATSGDITLAGNVTTTNLSGLAINSGANISTVGTGSITAGNISLNAATSASGDITFAHKYDLTSLSSASSDISVSAYNNISIGGGSDITARRNIAIVSNRDSVGTGAIYVGPGSELQGQLGSVILAGGTSGFLIPVGNAANKYGLHLDGVTITAGLNSGNALFLRGTGYADAGNGNVGVRIVNSTLNTTGLGAVSILANGGGTGASASNTGVYVGNSTISASGGGGMTITGNAGNTTGNSNAGIVIDDSDIYTTGAGTMALLGTGRGSGTSSNNYGIHILNGSAVSTADGLLSVSVATGGGAAAGTGSNNYGLYVTGTGTTLGATGTGGVTLSATGGGGTGGNQYGMVVEAGAVVQANGGAMTLTALAGSNTAGSAQTGLLVTGANSVIRNVGTGTIGITATGRGGGTSTASHGIELADGGRISTVNGNLTIVDAKGGGGGTTGIDSYGLYIHGTNSGIRSTGTGDLFITATSAATSTQATGNMGLRLDSANGITTTGGGAITVNATGRSGTAGLTGNSPGLYINGGSITGSGGAIIITGAAGNGRTVDNTGVRISGAGAGISNIGTGTIHVTGTGSGTTTATSSGIEILGGGSIVADDGNVTLVGIGGGGTNGSNNYGVYITGTGSTIRTIGDGAIHVTGTGGLATTGGTQHGIFIATMNGIQTTGGGAITLIGTGAPAATTGNFSAGIQIENGSVVGSGGAMNLTGTGGIGSGGGNGGIAVSGTNATIRNTGTGTLTLTGTGKGSGNAGTNRGISITAGASLESDDGNLTIHAFGGGGAGTGANNQGVYVSDADSVIRTLGDGNIDITATAGLLSTGNTHVGIYLLSQGSIKALGDGDITLEGTGGGSGTTSTADHGIYVLGGSSITGNGGRMELTGLGGLNGVGVVVSGTGSAISNIGGGDLIIEGTGGTGTVDSNFGVSVASGAIVSVENGLLDMTGHGGGTGISGSNHGIRVLTSSAAIRATGSGNIALLATGGGTASSASSNHGVAVGTSTANISVNTGTLDIDATGGGSSGVGLWVGAGGTIQSTGDNAGAMTIVARGGSGGGGNNIGVQLNDGSLITSKTGDMTVSAYGGGNGAGINNRGITFFGLARFTSIGNSALDAATITLNAYGGNGASHNEALVMDGNSIANSALIRSNIADVTINATAGADSDAIWLDRNAQIFAASTGDLAITAIADNAHHGVTSDGTGSSSIGRDKSDITIIANRLDLTHVTVSTDSDGTIVLRPYLASTTVGLGNAATGSFNLDATELANISGAGALTIGSAASTGDVDINAWNLGSQAYTVVVHGNDIDIGGLTLGNKNVQAIAHDAGGDLGSIHVSDAITKSVSGTTTLTLTVDESISFANNADITATTGVLNVALQADADSDAVGAVSLGGVDIVTNGGDLDVNKAVLLTGDTTINTGTGALSILGSINGGYSFTAVAKNMSFGGALGDSTRLDNVSLTSTDTLTLPAITADSIFARTTGATSDLALGSGQDLTAYDSGFAITLASARNFANNGSNISVVGGGKWRVFSASPTSNTVTGLNADFRRYSCTYGGSCPSYSVADGSGFLYSFTPVLTVTPDAVTITYGSAANLVNYHYSVSGYLSGDASADVVSGALNGTTGYVQYQNIGNYSIARQSGTLTSAMGYSFIYATSTNGLRVDPKMLNIIGITPRSKQQDGTLAAMLSGTATLNGLVNNDAVHLGGTPVANFASPLPGTGIAVTVTGYTISGAKAGNYTLSMPTGLSADILPGNTVTPPVPVVVLPTMLLTPQLPIDNTPSPITTHPTYHWASSESDTDAKDGDASQNMSCSNCGPDYKASNAAVTEIIKGLVSDGLLQLSSDLVIAYNEQQGLTRHT